MDIIQNKLNSAEPEFIRYNDGEVLVADGITEHQGINIELEWLVAAVETARISYKHFHYKLDLMQEKLRDVAI
ncbi:hypothetical protein GS399_10090 [Pedobacter sp. HMF7647]|uniref:Uncharacterized protein n=1 Tax=Hufsiella arboris TaxID=2695275 RepID=A0A7K1YB96_9SPHI|nr:hypothetical protein [Hufsiella arboris]MXV51318.1 hypothetical protein [Hufsiella arboris]